MTIAVGSQAPEFTLTSHTGESVSLSDYRGKKNVTLVFYPAALHGSLHWRAVRIARQLLDVHG